MFVSFLETVWAFLGTKTTRNLFRLTANIRRRHSCLLEALGGRDACGEIEFCRRIVASNGNQYLVDLDGSNRTVSSQLGCAKEPAMIVPRIFGSAAILIGLFNLPPAIVHGNKIEVVASTFLIIVGSFIVAIFRK